jgi:magnesium-dependent phosphatase 1
MYALKEKGIDMAIASRSPTPDIGKVFLDKLELQFMFVAQVLRNSLTSWSSNPFGLSFPFDALS